MPFHCLLASTVIDQNAAVADFSLFLYKMSPFFFCCLQNFLFFILFCSFTMIYQGHFCSCFWNLSWFGFPELLRSLVWCFSLFLKNLNHSLYKYFLCPILSSLSGIPFINMYMTVWYCPTVLGYFVLFHFSCSFSLCVSILVILLNYLQVQWFFLQLFWVHWRNYSSLIPYVLKKSNIFIRHFLIVFFSLLNFPIWSCMKVIFSTRSIKY